MKNFLYVVPDIRQQKHNIQEISLKKFQQQMPAKLLEATVKSEGQQREHKHFPKMDQTAPEDLGSTGPIL